MSEQAELLPSHAGPVSTSTISPEIQELMGRYETFLLDLELCSPELASDMASWVSAGWLASTMRQVVDESLGARLYGSLGPVTGILGTKMDPRHWQPTGETSAGQDIWVPASSSPMKAWFQGLFAAMAPPPGSDILRSILVRHGIKCDAEPAPQAKEFGGKVALLLSKPKLPKNSVPGLSRSAEPVQLWYPVAGSGKV